MTAKECILTRRSVRKFKDTPVDHAILEGIIETASYSPSWKHTQITRYIAIEGELKDRIARECFDAWPNNGTITASAPMLVALCMVKNRSGFERDGSYSTWREGSWQMFDVGIASQTFALACHEQGLGTVVLGIFDQKRLSNLLDIPEGQELVALMPVGYPAEEPKAPKRKSVEELLSYRS
ncbi:MAG: nitroreductase family protein [Lachnospiraceae bacterium]|nr:nitroreductase family protein [Lachnospiraceae bacterium]